LDTTMFMVHIRAHRADQIKSGKHKTRGDQIGLKIETWTTIITQAVIIVLEEAVKEVWNHSVKFVKSIILGCVGTKENQDVENTIDLAILQRTVIVIVTNN
jgi:hypothetical protein